MKKGDVPLRPKEGIRSKLRDGIHAVLGSITGIRRHKRRSLSMIAGLILGVSILAGLFIYTSALTNNVYDTIIAGTPAEVRFDFKGNLTDTQYDAYRNTFLGDVRISDVQIVYGDGRTVTTTRGASTNTFTVGRLSATLTVGQGQNDATGQATLIPSNFFSGEIGQRLKEKVIAGTNDLFSVERGIYLDQTIVEQQKLAVGSKIAQLSLAIRIPNPEATDLERIRGTTRATLLLSNLTLAGSISSDSGASAGIFSAIFETSKIYIPQDLISENVSFLTTLKDSEMRYALVKINEAELTLSDPGRANAEINQIINEYELSDDKLIGSNLVSGQLLPYQILNVFILLFDLILTLPVIILSFYLLSFGVDLSLQERSYYVGVLKTQGASPGQIKRKILGETAMLAVLGLVIGYIVAMFGAWSIGTASGFLKWDWNYALSVMPDFLLYDQTAFFIVGGFVVILLVIITNSKTNTFIGQEIGESIRKSEEHKESWMRRNHFDIIFFGIGVLALILAVLPEAGISLDLGNLGLLQSIISVLGPILLWFGGASLVGRISAWVPAKVDPILRRIGYFKDVAIIVKSNVLRKSGDFPRLAVIIALTVSFATVAVVQGQTGQVHNDRLVTWNIGSDIIVHSSPNSSVIIESEIQQKSQLIESVMGIASTAGKVLNDPIQVYAVNNEFDSVAIWQNDNFAGDREKALAYLETNSSNAALIGKELATQESLEIGAVVEVEFLSYFWNGTGVDYGYISHNTTIMGIFDHLPGGITATDLVVHHGLFNMLYNISSANITVLGVKMSGSASGVIADTYLVRLGEGVDAPTIKDQILNIPGVTTAKSLVQELSRINELQNADFGIPGLLTADFLVSLFAATIGCYIFMSILLEKRKKEFAILRSYGASRRQVYKLVLSESVVVLVSALAWALVVGLMLAYLFNGLFETINVFVSSPEQLLQAQIRRLLIFDWFNIIFTILVVLLALLIATLIAIRSSIRANIADELRQL